MPKSDPLRTCKVCGLFSEDYYPWGENGTSPTFDICECCGTEFGYEDCTPDSTVMARKAWIRGGCKIFRSKNLSHEWKLHDSLGNIINEVDIDILESEPHVVTVTEKSGIVVFYDPDSDTFAIKKVKMNQTYDD